jgi:hypothetical protein
MALQNKTRYKIAIVPAVIFWFASIVFFITGLSFGDKSGVMFWIALLLGLSNTVIQIIGNDSNAEDIGMVLFIGWIASYALGIGSNVNSLMMTIQIDNRILEWTVCLSLGAMVEVLPERLFVLFWRSVAPNFSFSAYRPRYNTPQRNNNRPVNQSRSQQVRSRRSPYDGFHPINREDAMEAAEALYTEGEE